MPQIYPNNNSQKRGNARLPKLFVVELQVGDKVYSAEGRTRQQAKHEAAVQGGYQTNAEIISNPVKLAFMNSF